MLPTIVWAGRNDLHQGRRTGVSALLPPQHAHAVRLAVAGVNRAVRVDENAVQARHLAGQRVAVGPVAFFAGAGDEFEIARLRVDHSYRVAFGVGEPGVAGGVDGDPFRTFERRQLRGSAVAG